MAIMKNDSHLNFTAYTRPLLHRDLNGNVGNLDGFVSVWRRNRAFTDEEVFLGVVSSRYKIHQNADIFAVVEQELTKRFDPAQIQIKDEWTDHGAVCLRQYIILDKMVQLDGLSKIGFRVVVMNSFNGSKSCTLLAGAIDFFCTNGMISGEFDRLSSTHHARLNADKLSLFLNQAYLAFGKDTEIMKSAVGVSCTPDAGKDLLLKLNETDKFKDNIRTALLDNMYQRGDNLWAVISTATWWASVEGDNWAVPRSDAAMNNAPIRRIERQREVRTWMKKHINPLIITHEAAQ